MPKRFSERILEFLKRPQYKPMRAQRLARELGIAEAEHGDFHDAVDALRRVGRVVIGTDNALLLPQPAGQIVGTYRANPRGFGFVVPDEPEAHGDLFIPPGKALDAITGDKVLCKVIERGQRAGKEALGGRVIKIIERGDSRFVGRLHHEGGIWFVRPDGNALHVPILIGDPTAKSAKAGDQVVVEIVSYPMAGRPARGVIVERLGKAGQPNVDLLSMVRQFHLPDEFPRSVQDEARAAGRRFDAQAVAEARQDISHLTTITIDPDDARDFDDAITLERLTDEAAGAKTGGRKVAGARTPGARIPGARIPSRTHVSEDPAAGARILSRTHVNPAGARILSRTHVRGSAFGGFPRVISAPGFTSEMASDARLSASAKDTAGGLRRRSRRNVPAGADSGSEAVWELGVHIADVSFFVRRGGAIDQEAEARGTSVYFPRYVIPMLPEMLSNGVCSLQEGEPRLCKSAFIRYDEHGRVVGTRFANTIIRSAKRLTYGEATAILDGRTEGYAPKVVALVRRMDRLAKVIRQRRLEQGMLELDLPEVDVILDDAGRPTDARPADTSFSHKIIEAFMVEANEAVGRLLRDLGVPFIRRIHPEPDEAALAAMARFLRASGYALPRSLDAKDIQSLLTSLRGHPESYAVNLAVLKSLQLAEYSPEAVGHFGLGSDCYTHFTSPIRRYPDLMVHRLLGLYLDGRIKRGRRAFADDVPSDEALVDAGRRLSYLSRRAESAEREFKTLKILQMLEQQVGEVFEGVVTGVTNFGLFIQHPRYLIDGLLRIEHLGDDWWQVDLPSGRVVGARTHRAFTLGTRVNVQIAQVDLAARQLNLGLPPDEKRKQRPGKGRPAEKPQPKGRPRRPVERSRGRRSARRGRR